MTGHDAAEDQCPGVAGPRHGALSIMALELQEKGWVPLLGNGDIGARRKDKNKKKKTYTTKSSLRAGYDFI